jgi:hypothetical protein
MDATTFTVSAHTSLASAFAVIGAPGSESRTGAIYTFTSGPILGQNYSLRQVITIPGASPKDSFGTSLSLSGDGTLLVAGAPGLNSSTGGLYVFTCR